VESHPSENEGWCTRQGCGTPALILTICGEEGVPESRKGGKAIIDILLTKNVGIFYHLFDFVQISGLQKPLVRDFPICYAICDLVYVKSFDFVKTEIARNSVES